ncbi:DUF6098 family protein [Leucobacter sp. USHLN153]|uniref:DUF6098 family protein n=1 Tax=Leucobacter sp. USHLN153 TaxID=3081268 RepID=UPI00301668C0
MTELAFEPHFGITEELSHLESSHDGKRPFGAFEIAPLESMYDLESMLRRYPELHIRYSEGPEADSERGSVDTESGLELPGISVNPLQPERWWFRPVADWLARQVCQYRHLQERNPQRFPWVLTGHFVGRGPDCEPLLKNVVPIARLGGGAISEAAERYERRFDAGKGPEGRED